MYYLYILLNFFKFLQDNFIHHIIYIKHFHLNEFLYYLFKNIYFIYRNVLQHIYYDQCQDHQKLLNKIHFYIYYIDLHYLIINNQQHLLQHIPLMIIYIHLHINYKQKQYQFFNYYKFYNFKLKVNFYIQIIF